jgi:succinate dehydrogenase (ubiquinone) membrane anchor subunit
MQLNSNTFPADVSLLLLVQNFPAYSRLPSAIYQGTVNDPTPFPAPSKSHGSYHWAFERLLAASLLPLTGAAFATSGTAYPLLDGILGVSLIMHSHIGVRSLYLFWRRLLTLTTK